MFSILVDGFYGEFKTYAIQFEEEFRVAILNEKTGSESNTFKHLINFYKNTQFCCYKTDYYIDFLIHHVNLIDSLYDQSAEFG